VGGERGGAAKKQEYGAKAYNRAKSHRERGGVKNRFGRGGVGGKRRE